jgi:hypothetical protein
MYGLAKKSLGAGCTFEEVAEKIKCQKMNVNLCITRFGWIISPRLVSKRQNPFKLIYSIMTLNTISLPCKAGPTKIDQAKGKQEKKSRQYYFYTSPLRYTRIGVHDIPNWINWLGPSPYLTGSNFWKFYLIKISFKLGDRSLWWKCLDWNGFFGCSECGHSK